MVNLGRPETKVLADDWTAVTRDKSLSAQFEHSVGVTADGCEIFTLSPANRFHPRITSYNVCYTKLLRQVKGSCRRSAATAADTKRCRRIG